MIKKIKELVTSPNFWRAAVFYIVSLGLGLAGYFFVGGSAGDFLLTCFPGFGTGVAAALLNNGHKQPVTLKSSATTFGMLLVFTAGSYILGIAIIAVFVGFGCSVLGGIIGLRFCIWENKKRAKSAQTDTDNITNSEDIDKAQK